MVTGINQRFFRKARQDPGNREFFRTLAPAKFRDFLPQLAYATAGLMAGVLFLVARPGSWVAIGCVVFALAGAGHFLLIQHRFWDRSMVTTEAEGAATDEETE